MAGRSAVVWVFVFALAASANAQSGSSGTSAAQNSAGVPAQSSSTTTADVRPATTTLYGDTGLWFVPTAEVPAHGKWSASGYRRATNFIQGYTYIGDFAGTFGVGLGDRAELLGSFLVDTRIDRHTRPLFVNDFYVAAKINRQRQGGPLRGTG